MNKFTWKNLGIWIAVLIIDIINGHGLLDKLGTALTEAKASLKSKLDKK